MPTASQGATFLPYGDGTNIVLFGGLREGSVQNDPLWTLNITAFDDPNTVLTWRQVDTVRVGTCGVIRDEHKSFVVHNRMYVIASTSAPQLDTCVLDLVSWTWSQPVGLRSDAANVPGNVRTLMAAMIGTKIVVVGYVCPSLLRLPLTVLLMTNR